MARGTALSTRDRRFLILLGLPAFSLSLAVTAVSALLPVLLVERSGPLVTGAVIGSEGIMALVVPLLVGRWSDRRGARLPFMAAGGLLAATGVALMALGDSLLWLALTLVVFQVGYFTAFTPYWALYPDLIDTEQSGRSQGSMGVWREVGLGLALVGGPLALSLWRPLPFLLVAAVLVVTMPVFGAIVARRVAGEDRPAQPQGAASVLALVRERPAIGWFMAANALWEGALAALRAFVVLFFVVGLGRELSTVSAVLAVVAVTALVAAPASGWLADRFGRQRVMWYALIVYTAFMAVPVFWHTAATVAIIPIGAFAAVAVMTLPLALLMDLLPEGSHGSAAGLFGLSRGLGLVLGPVLAGLAIQLLEPTFSDTNGYAAMFLVATIALALSLVVLRRADPTSPRDRRRRPAPRRTQRARRDAGPSERLRLR